jgi:hypothetical protein
VRLPDQPLPSTASQYLSRSASVAATWGLSAQQGKFR